MTILARTGLSAFRRNWFVVEALPLVGLIGGVLGFATFCGLRALKAPDVTINKTSNPYPWLNVKPQENTHMLPGSRSNTIPYKRESW